MGVGDERNKQMSEKATHGGYQGEVVAHDTYLRCDGCGWSYSLDYGDEGCGECGGELSERRANPAPEATLRLNLFR
jgi:rRNA maturation endonuclease Nob1